MAPGADASKEATYFPNLNQLPGVRKQVDALGAEYHLPSRRWYVPAGVSLAPFAEWLVRPADALDERTIIDYDMGAMRERQKEVSALGALFDGERKRWYIPSGLSLAPFQEYLRPPEPTYIDIDMRNKPAQRAQISALGGKFDKQRQRWYVPAGASLSPFARWLSCGYDVEAALERIMSICQVDMALARAALQQFGCQGNAVKRLLKGWRPS